MRMGMLKPQIMGRLKMKHASLLPLEDGRDTSLFFVISVLCFLTALCVLAGKASYNMTAGWAHGVQNSYTLSVEADATALANITQRLSNTAGIAQVSVVSDAEISDILTQRLGTDRLPEGLSVPTLIEISLDVDSNLDADALVGIASSDADTPVIYSHAGWVSQIDTYLMAVRAFVVVTSGLLILSTILIVGFATHSSLYARRDIISVLHRFGAQDGFVAKIFQKRFWLLGVRAGACGAIAALALMAGLAWFMLSDAYFKEIIPPFNVTVWDLVILCIIPFVIGFIAQFTARKTVLNALQKLF